MSRQDLGQGMDGWQVLDPTPQERSGGVEHKICFQGELSLFLFCIFVWTFVIFLKMLLVAPILNTYMKKKTNV